MAQVAVVQDAVAQDTVAQDAVAQTVEPQDGEAPAAEVQDVVAQAVETHMDHHRRHAVAVVVVQVSIFLATIENL